MCDTLQFKTTVKFNIKGDAIGIAIGLFENNTRYNNYENNKQYYYCNFNRFLIK